MANIKTDHDDIYAVSRAIFLHLPQRKALLEMTLEKADLEDIFIELTESSAIMLKPKPQKGSRHESRNRKGRWLTIDGGVKT